MYFSVDPANAQPNKHIIITSKRRLWRNNYVFIMFCVCREHYLVVNYRAQGWSGIWCRHKDTFFSVVVRPYCHCKIKSQGSIYTRRRSLYLNGGHGVRYTLVTKGLVYWQSLTEPNIGIRIWISNYIHVKYWDALTALTTKCLVKRPLTSMHG